MLLLGGALLALSLGVLPLPLAPRLALAVVLALLQGGWARRQRWSLSQLLAWLLALLLLGGWGWLGRPQPSATDPVQRIPPHQQSLRIQLDGRLRQDPRPIGAACQALADVPKGRVRLRFRDCPDLQQGWRVQLEGRLRRLRRGPHPLLPGAAERLASKGVWSEIQVERWSLIGRPPTPMADVRRHIASELRRAGGEEPGGLLAALVLGQAMVPLPASLRADFRAAGLSHALAASGFHLSVLLGAVLLFSRRAPALIRWPAAFGAMGLFGLLAGAQASVVRALLMGAVAFVLKERGRRSRPLAVLLLCLLLMLLLRPSWLLDVGFQLSAAATGGLILSAGPVEERLQCWLPRWAAAGVAVPLAASLWTLPLQLLHFGVVPSYAVLANVLAAPLLTPLTLGAMAMALTAVLMPPLLGLLAAGPGAAGPAPLGLGGVHGALAAGPVADRAAGTAFGGALSGGAAALAAFGRPPLAAVVSAPAGPRGGVALLAAEPGCIAVGAPGSAPMVGAPSPGPGRAGEPESGPQQLRPRRPIGPGAGRGPLRLAARAGSAASGAPPLLVSPGPHDGRSPVAGSAAAEPRAGRPSPQPR